MISGGIKNRIIHDEINVMNLSFHNYNEKEPTPLSFILALPVSLMVKASEIM